ncbi:MAG: hypothetical protein ABSE08_20130 [Syntrophobacteraceae bacterium]
MYAGPARLGGSAAINSSARRFCKLGPLSNSTIGEAGLVCHGADFEQVQARVARFVPRSGRIERTAPAGRGFDSLFMR